MPKAVVEFLGWMFIIALLFLTGATLFFFIFYYLPGTTCVDKQRQELAELTEKIGSMVEYAAKTNFSIYTCVENVRIKSVDGQQELCLEFGKVFFLPKEETCLKGLIFENRVGEIVPGEYEVLIDKRELVRRVTFLRKID